MNKEKLCCRQLWDSQKIPMKYLLLVVELIRKMVLWKLIFIASVVYFYFELSFFIAFSINLLFLGIYKYPIIVTGLERIQGPIEMPIPVNLEGDVDFENIFNIYYYKPFIYFICYIIIYFFDCLHVFHLAISQYCLEAVLLPLMGTNKWMKNWVLLFLNLLFLKLCLCKQLIKVWSENTFI